MATATSPASDSGNDDLSSSTTTEQQLENDDALEALQLRYKFEEHKFGGLVWRSLRDAGWTYKTTSGCYASPGDNGRVFQSSDEISKYLDQFAFQDVCSNLQSTTSTTTTAQTAAEVTDEEQRLVGQKLRNDILHHMSQLTSKGEASNDKDDSEADLEIVAKDAAARTTLNRPRRSTRAAATSNNNNNKHHASVTATERGTDLYLHRNSKGRKSKKKAKPTSSSLEVTKSELLVFPSLEECADMIKGYYPDDDKVKAVEDSYKKDFADWRFLLSTNHSLLFFGSGSKFNLLNAFCEEELDKEGYALVINGFDKEVRVDSILDLLVALFLDGNEPAPMSAMDNEDGGDFPVIGVSNPWRAHPLIERAICVSRAMAYKAAESLVPVFLVIHNIDGEGLRNSLAQEALAALLVNSTVENGVASIRLVASVDHVDAAALLWSVPTTANFAWIWKEVHTHRPYVEELVMINDQYSRKKAGRKKSLEASKAQRVLEVLKALAPRHTEVVQILARLQLERSGGGGGGGGDSWVDYLTFRSQCKSSCAVNKDSQLRAFVSELRDHGLIVSKKDDSSEFVRIPFNTSKLREILAYDRNNDPGDRS